MNLFRAKTLQAFRDKFASVESSEKNYRVTTFTDVNTPTPSRTVTPRKPIIGSFALVAGSGTGELDLSWTIDAHGVDIQSFLAYVSEDGGAIATTDLSGETSPFTYTASEGDLDVSIYLELVTAGGTVVTATLTEASAA